MGDDNLQIDPALVKAGCSVLLLLLLIPPALFVLGDQLFSLRGIIAGPFLFLALYSLSRRVPMPPDDGSKRRLIFCILRAVLFAFVTWLVFITLAHLDKINGLGFWADLVTLQASVPRGIGSFTALLMALTVGVLSLPVSAEAAGPIANYVEKVLSKVTFFESGDHASAHAKARMDAIRQRRKTPGGSA